MFHVWQPQLNMPGWARPGQVRNIKKHIQGVQCIMCGSTSSICQVRLGQDRLEILKTYLGNTMYYVWQPQLHMPGQVRPGQVRNIKKHVQGILDNICGSQSSIWQVILGQERLQIVKHIQGLTDNICGSPSSMWQVRFGHVRLEI